jgi:hypothetical protein
MHHRSNIIHFAFTTIALLTGVIYSLTKYDLHFLGSRSLPRLSSRQPIVVNLLKGKPSSLMDQKENENPLCDGNTYI